MAHQLVHRLETVLRGQLGGAVLELGGPQALVRRVVLPVNPLAVSAEGQGEGLDKGGIHAGIRIQRLLNVDNEGVPAALRQGQGNELVPVEHPPGGEPGLPRQLQHFLRQLQLVQGLGVVPLGELRLIVLPKLLHCPGVLRRQGADLRLGPLGPEFLDVVPLAGVAPPGEILEVLPVIHVIPPGADIADPDIGIAAQQLPSLVLRHHGNDRKLPRLQAVSLNGPQGRVHVPLRPGDRVVEVPPARVPVADHKAARDLRPGRVKRLLPHELGPQRVLAEAVIAVLVVAAELGAVLLCHWFKLLHKSHP